MKRSRKLIFALLVASLVLAMSVPAFAASKKKKALRAYNAYMAGLPSSYEFDVVYITKDSVPELMVRRSYSSKSLFTFKNGRMSEIELTMPYYVSGYYKKRGVIVNFFAHGGYSPLRYTEYYKISSGKMVPKLRYEKAGQLNFSTDKYSWNQVYSKFRANGQAVSIKKAKYKSLLKKMVGSRKKLTFKYKANTAANRAKYLG